MIAEIIAGLALFFAGLAIGVSVTNNRYVSCYETTASDSPRPLPMNPKHTITDGELKKVQPNGDPLVGVGKMQSQQKIIPLNHINTTNHFGILRFIMGDETGELFICNVCRRVFFFKNGWAVA